MKKNIQKRSYALTGIAAFGLLQAGCLAVPSPATNEPALLNSTSSEPTPATLAASARPGQPFQIVAAPPPSKPVIIPPRATLLAARAAVKQELKDPESAQFSLEVQWPTAVCGFVNSKNSYGGYVGASSYIYVLATKEAFIRQRGTDAETLIASMKLRQKYCPD